MPAQRSYSKKNSGADSVQELKAAMEALKTGEFSPVYLLCGDQSYLRLQYRDRIRSALLGDGDEMNVTRFKGGDFDVREVIEAAETLPFFAERRIVILEDTGLFRAGQGAKKRGIAKETTGKAEEDQAGSSSGGGTSDRLAEFLGRLPSTTHLIFVEEETDARSRLYQAAAKYGRILRCDAPGKSGLESWVRAKLRRSGMVISPPVLTDFLDRTGDDMMNIDSELEKLTAYCYGRSEVTRQDLEAIGSSQLRDRIFELIDSIIAGNTQRAMVIYMEMLARQTAPQQILALMIRQINQLLQLRELSQQKGWQEATAVLKLSPFVAGKLRDSLRRYSSDALISALKACLNADSEYKSGRIDAGIALERLIVQIAG